MLPSARQCKGRPDNGLWFIAGWLDSDPARLAAFLRDYLGDRGYDLGDLRTALAWFAFLLGGRDGEDLFADREP